MTRHLARLALRAARPTGGLRPRSPSMFESAVAPPVLEQYAARVPAAVGEPPPPSSDAAGPRPTVRTVPDPDPPKPVGPAGEHRLLTAEAQRVPHRRELVTPEPGRPAAPSRTALRLDAPSRSAPPLRPLPDAARADDVGMPQPAPHPGPAQGARSGPDPSRSPTAEPASVERAGPATYSPGPTASETAAAPGATETPSAPPHTEQPRLDAPPVRLPRLQPPPGPDEQRAPEVTVTIGRIEVLPPARPERPPVGQKRPTRAASGAPKLSDYLRDRSRR